MKDETKLKAAFGIGAIGKDMVYALSSGYVLYYYQDILGMSATFVGAVLMAARIFDALNDPLMGILVQKTHSKWGRFAPWIFSGTVLNAVVLYALFKAPDLSAAGLLVYFPIVYVLWGVTYTMMDIPFWSLIPTLTVSGKDREEMSVVGRTCAGVGNAIVTVGTPLIVKMLGSGTERTGFGRYALIVAALFVIFEWILVRRLPKGEAAQEKKSEAVTVRSMFHSLFHNDQAMVTALTIILVNSALYITSNLILYFFKYDLGGSDWQNAYTVFSTVGGASQILGMMILYPLLRKKWSNTQIFRLCLVAAIAGYGILLGTTFVVAELKVGELLVPAFLVFAANGILTILTTVFLSNTVDYGEYRSGRREESVIFSMQTFVVKAASGFAVFICGIGLDAIGIEKVQSTDAIIGLRLLMTIGPIILLFVALLFFVKKFRLTDDYAAQISEELKEGRHETEVDSASE
ncbi:glycoside-pentoside-hexuronide (GPH):cation symporter [Galactobacillus timonensis]|uniref:glycoside-pentoside-hexuronide (GPH):cation symporter n=1 Tax=Galactobacillus timonensis TaxID=2041840 RepID=UPI0023EF5E0C|nr:glycoside-pentoside-hexuronide (GPH):cation symporter [Galactobacillus timonensis]MCI6753750.1 glycoside-pentoside-hexuronide (GPH):cation symporter [Galactobacillus timonensis]